MKHYFGHLTFFKKIKTTNVRSLILTLKGWSGGAMVLGKLPLPGRLLIWIKVGQGPTALAVGADGDCLVIFSFACHLSFLSPSLCETARYRLKNCLKGPLSPKQPTNKITLTLYLGKCFGLWHFE